MSENILAEVYFVIFLQPWVSFVEFAQGGRQSDRDQSFFYQEHGRSGFPNVARQAACVWIGSAGYSQKAWLKFRMVCHAMR
jgi:hypothetical protein